MNRSHIIPALSLVKCITKDKLFKILPFSKRTELKTANNLIAIPVLDIKLVKGNFSQQNIPTTYKSKSAVLLDGNNYFAELAVRDVFSSIGSEVYWIDCFHKKIWDGNDINLNRKPLDICLIPSLKPYYEANGNSYKGMWDVVIIREDGEVIFLDCNGRPANDKINKNQIRFLERCIAKRLYNDTFIIVEWDYERFHH